MNQEHPWQVRDRAAETALIGLLTTAVAELSGLAQPAFVAASPFKHDDMGHHTDWLAVQVGWARWERTAYGLDVVEERSVNPDHLAAARGTLGRLEEGKWRALAEMMFGVSFGDEIIGLVLAHDVAWLVICSTGTGTYDVAFLLDPAGMGLLDVGAAERLDGTLGQGRPFRLERIWAASWPALHAAAPLFPCKLPRPATDEAREARRQLARLVEAASVLLRPLPGRVRYVAGCHRSSNYGPRRGWRVVAADAAKVNNLYMRTGTGHDVGRYAQEVSRGGTVLLALDGLLTVLDAAGWGDLFVAGVMPLEQSDALALLAHDAEVWLVAAGTVFAVDQGDDLKVVGACDDPADSPDPRRSVVHLFDGRSLVPPELPPIPPRPENQGSLTVNLRPQSPGVH